MPSWIFAVQYLFQTLLRNLAGLGTRVANYLPSNSLGDLYIYLIMTTAFLEGVIWQISVSAPSARQNETVYFLIGLLSSKIVD